MAMGCDGIIPDVTVNERSTVPYCECTVSCLCQKKKHVYLYQHRLPYEWGTGW